MKKAFRNALLGTTFSKINRETILALIWEETIRSNFVTLFWGIG
jgi:hypothetical protein